jgi:hypothetical protein
MALDCFEVRVDPAGYIRWPDGGGFQPVELRVNGPGLIDLVREIELPFAHESRYTRLGCERPYPPANNRRFRASAVRRSRQRTRFTGSPT